MSQSAKNLLPLQKKQETRPPNGKTGISSNRRNLPFRVKTGLKKGIRTPHGWYGVGGKGEVGWLGGRGVRVRGGGGGWGKNCKNRNKEQVSALGGLVKEGRELGRKKEEKITRQLKGSGIVNVRRRLRVRKSWGNKAGPAKSP